MRIAVAGGTGTVGRHVVDSLTASGHEALIVARSTGVDLTTGDGLAELLVGVDAVVDVTSIATTAADASVGFFRTVTGNLLDAEEKAGVPHHLALSIVGAARINAGYYAGKKVQEDLVLATGGRGTVVRATQFHEFVYQLLAAGAVGPLQLVPTFVSQPIAAWEVGEIVARLAVGAPAGLAAELAGPRVERMADLVRRYLRATGSRRPVLEVPFPGAFGRGLRDKSALPAEGVTLGGQTFDDWLYTVASTASSTR
jgi:uncharacterized protein YbjT (DUF2867 family)